MSDLAYADFDNPKVHYACADPPILPLLMKWRRIFYRPHNSHPLTGDPHQAA